VSCASIVNHAVGGDQAFWRQGCPFAADADSHDIGDLLPINPWIVILNMPISGPLTTDLPKLIVPRQKLRAQASTSTIDRMRK
jgi:hypothetical protein